MHDDVVLLLPGAAAPVSPDPALLGQKGAGLCQMAQRGLPVPPALILPSTLWPEFQRTGSFPDSFWHQVEEKLALIGAKVDAQLGNPEKPLLLSVRSGAKVSMPGMLETLLNVGVSEKTLPGLIARLGDERCALDCRRRFLHQYAALVYGLRPDTVLLPDPLELLLFELRQTRGVTHDEELSADDLRGLCQKYQELIAKRAGKPVPEDAFTQLREAVYAVLRSFFSPRAEEYRRMQGIPSDIGTAVTLQAMVFGNLGPNSATGVVFSRDPRSGQKGLYGEFLLEAQGDDLVSGGFTPRPIAELAPLLPDAYAQLDLAVQQLEQDLGDLQDVEFTIERGRLFLLQTRAGKRSARAMVKVACDLVREGRVSQEEAIRRCEPKRFAELLLPTVDPKTSAPTIARGLPASPGAATGPVVFTAQDAVEQRRKGIGCILVRGETSTDDIVGIEAAAGLLTTRGGMTSHAAVVARGMGRCAIVGCSTLKVDLARRTASTHAYTIRQGDLVTLDGHRGLLLLGSLPLSLSHVHDDADVALLSNWAMATARVPIWARLHSDNDRTLARDLPISRLVRLDPPSDGGIRTLHVETLLPQVPPQPGVLLPLSEANRLPQLTTEHSLIALETTTLPQDDLAPTIAEARRVAGQKGVQIGLLVNEPLSVEPRLHALAISLKLGFVACPLLRTPLAWLVAARTALDTTS